MSKQTYPKGYEPMSDPTEVLRNMRAYAQGCYRRGDIMGFDRTLENIVKVETLWAEQTARGW